MTSYLRCALLAVCLSAGVTPLRAASDVAALEVAKREARGQHVARVAALSRDIESNNADGSTLANLLRERGVALSHLLRYDDAVADFTRAIELDGFNPQFYQDRAIVLLRQRNYTGANTDLDMVLGLDRGNFSGLREKGRAAFYQSEFDVAADYFLKAARTVDREAQVYAVLWVTLATHRAGRPSPLSVKVSGDPEKAPRPVPVADLLAGGSTPEQVMARAKSDTAITHLELQCEAHFYVGQYHLIKGDKAAAKAHFEAAVATEVTDYMEYDWARRELEALN